MATLTKCIKQYVNRYETEGDLKLKTKWHDYLNYILVLNLIGIIGFGLLLIYSFYEKQVVTEIDADDIFFWLGKTITITSTLRYLIGFILALVELIVFEISNVVFMLHCFFIELYKNIQLEEA